MAHLANLVGYGTRFFCGEAAEALKFDKRLLFVIPVLVLLGLYFVLTSPTQGPVSSSESKNTITSRGPLVQLDQIVSGGPPPDGIPSIDNPKFVSSDQANFLKDSDMVIGLHDNGTAKAYPLLILVWHEIVNDVVGGTPIAVTYCPLCYSTQAFIREIEGRTVQFGTSGKLYNNNLVMYDRWSKSLWSQEWGVAIAGNLSGYTLQRIPIDVMPWRVWKELYPNTLVLSEDTGYPRSYGTDPYGNYYTTPGVYFPLNHEDSRLPQKTIVMSLSLNGSNEAYPLSTFNKAGVLSNTVSNRDVVFFSISGGVARAFSPVVGGKELHFQYVDGKFVDVETNSVWNYDGVAISGSMRGSLLHRLVVETSFWFAWSAFYPDTSVFASSY